ncbi:MAG: DUF1553 domain-containing protein, partial [Verrucomicrobia bacterium]|nr:DUF1553 domain-containing protein [Verrucomicrobiota bacterium]
QPREEHEARLQEVAEVFYGPLGLLSPPSDRKPFWSKAHQDRVADLQTKLQTQLSNAPLPEAFAMAVEDSKPEDLPVYARGSHLSPGKDTIPRDIPAVLRTTGSLAIAPDASGRLEFATWLISRANPLVSRVTVNRVWQALFGQGLVPSSDNFGIRGDPPSHPELLDWLAAEFIETGWDFKRMLRTILSSQAYQQSSRAVGTRPSTSDADVNPLTLFPRQRMEAEMIRDSILALSGQLDPSMGGSMVSWKNNEYVPDGDATPFDKPRRSIYLPVIRDRMQEVFTLFDAANPSVGCSRRAETTAPHQALFFMNSPLVKSAAKEMAARLLKEPGSEAERIGQAYRMLFNRTPSESELTHCLAFLRESSAGGKRSVEKTWASLVQALCASNEFVLIE